MTEVRPVIEVRAGDRVRTLRYARGLCKERELPIPVDLASIPDEIVDELQAWLRSSPATYEATEMGTAHRLLDQHGEDLLYVAGPGTWHHWDGRRWAYDVDGEVHRRLKATVDRMPDEIRSAQDPAREKALFRHYQAAQTARVQSGILTLARTETAVATSVDRLDRDPWALNVVNGTVDLRTGVLREHRRSDRITKLAPVEFDPDAEAPTWISFVEWAMNGDAELVRFLRQLVGYSLTGDVTEQVLPFCHGAGENGKSTFLGTVQELLGMSDDGYALQAAPRLLLTSRREEHPTSIAELVGRRFVVSQEADKGARLDEALVKQLTGGDPIKGRFMRADFFTFRPTFKLWLAANHKPKIRGTDHAIWRRMRLIPFNATVTKRDNRLADKLKHELPGILQWAIEGCQDWRRNGLITPAVVQQATGDYRANEDVIGRFIEDRCEPTGWIINKDLREAYIAWCEQQGERPITMNDLAAELLERGYERGRFGRNRDRGFAGIQLADPNRLPLDERPSVRGTT